MSSALARVFGLRCRFVEVVQRSILPRSSVTVIPVLYRKLELPTRLAYPPRLGFVMAPPRPHPQESPMASHRGRGARDNADHARPSRDPDPKRPTPLRGRSLVSPAANKSAASEGATSRRTTRCSGTAKIVPVPPNGTLTWMHPRVAASSPIVDPSSGTTTRTRVPGETRSGKSCACTLPGAARTKKRTTVRVNRAIGTSDSVRLPTALVASSCLHRHGSHPHPETDEAR